jgi:HEAT repeats
MRGSLQSFTVGPCTRQPSGGFEPRAFKSGAPKRLHLYFLCFASLAVASTFAGYEASRFTGRSPWAGSDVVEAAAVSAASAPALPSNSADFTRLAPQEQAERALESAIQHDAQSLEGISKNVDVWRGHLTDNGRLFDLVHSALNSSDLRVRSAAIEIDLAANNLSKSPDTVTRLVKKLHDDPGDRPWTLWRLGALGNRGVQRDVVLTQLLTYVRDRDEETRYWAVEGLAILGADASVDPLLERFAHDRSIRVRQRAAANLAQSGMLTREQRLAAVPQLLNFFDDDGLDSATRGWVYGALRMITGAQLGNDANAWRKWWAKRDTASQHAHRPTKTLYA